jgi:hypothetical protein
LPARLRAEGYHARANRLIKLGFLLKLAISIAASAVCYVGSAVIASIVLNRPELTSFMQLASLVIVFFSNSTGTREHRLRGNRCISFPNGISIGANSVVDKSFLEEGIGIGGVPARKINEEGSEGLLVKATEILASRQKPSD